MTYTQQGERVTLEMTRDDYDRLMIMLGYACGASRARSEISLFWSWLRFTNELNNGNPNFTPYEIPPEFGGKLEAGDAAENH
jgi:hypothetical protein